MKNKAQIKGNNNTVIQDVNSTKTENKKSKVALWSLIVTIIGVLIAAIVGWSEIIKFFKTI